MLKNQEYQVKWEPEFNYLVDTITVRWKGGVRYTSGVFFSTL